MCSANTSNLNFWNILNFFASLELNLSDFYCSFKQDVSLTNLCFLFSVHSCISVIIFGRLHEQEHMNPEYEHLKSKIINAAGGRWFWQLLLLIQKGQNVADQLWFAGMSFFLLPCQCFLMENDILSSHCARSDRKPLQHVAIRLIRCCKFNFAGVLWESVALERKKGLLHYLCK